jgi:hypothetical protein
MTSPLQHRPMSEQPAVRSQIKGASKLPRYPHGHVIETVSSRPPVRRLDAVIYFDMITESESNLWNLLSSPLTYPRLTSSAFHAILEPNITRTHNVGYKLKYMDAKCIRSLFSPSAMPTHV